LQADNQARRADAEEPGIWRRDAGFDPVVIGSLERSRIFDLGQPLANGRWTAEQMRAALASGDQDRPIVQ